MHTMNTQEGVLWFNTRSNQLEIFFKGEWQPVHPTALVDREENPIRTQQKNLWKLAAKLFNQFPRRTYY